MTQEPRPAAPDEATVVMSKPAAQSAAATVINQSVVGMSASGNSVAMGNSGITRSGHVAAPEKPRSIILALAGGAATGLVLFALTALWLLRGQ